MNEAAEIAWQKRVQDNRSVFYDMAHWQIRALKVEFMAGWDAAEEHRTHYADDLKGKFVETKKVPPQSDDHSGTILPETHWTTTSGTIVTSPTS